MWKAFLIGCRDWENKGEGNFTEHTQYNNIERKNETHVCLIFKFTSGTMFASSLCDYVTFMHFLLVSFTVL